MATRQLSSLDDNHDPEYDSTKMTISTAGQVVETSLAQLKSLNDASRRKAMVLQIPETLKREAETDELKVNLGPKSPVDIDLTLHSRNGEELRLRGRCTRRQLHSKPNKEGLRLHRLIIDLDLGFELDLLTADGEVVDRHTYGELDRDAPNQGEPLPFDI